METINKREAWNKGNLAHALRSRACVWPLSGSMMYWNSRPVAGIGSSCPKQTFILSQMQNEQILVALSPFS